MVQRADQVLRERARPLWVRGEVSGWKRYPSGHCFFTLKDEQAELCCVLWAGAARLLPALPDNGLEVEVFGQIGVYPRRGQFRLEVTRIESTGIGGMWGLAKDRLIEKLRREGLPDENRKRALPDYPERVRRYFRQEGLLPGFELVPESHPSYDPALEQAFAPHPPLLLAREMDGRGR